MGDAYWAASDALVDGGRDQARRGPSKVQRRQRGKRRVVESMVVMKALGHLNEDGEPVVMCVGTE